MHDHPAPTGAPPTATVDRAADAFAAYASEHGLAAAFARLAPDLDPDDPPEARAELVELAQLAAGDAEVIAALDVAHETADPDVKARWITERGAIIADRVARLLRVRRIARSYRADRDRRGPRRAAPSTPPRQARRGGRAPRRSRSATRSSSASGGGGDGGDEPGEPEPRAGDAPLVVIVSAAADAAAGETAVARAFEAYLSRTRPERTWTVGRRGERS